MFGKKEIRHLIIGILILSFVFGFNDGRENFVFGYWLLNFLMVLAVVTISVLVRELVRKFVAHRKGCRTEYNLWFVKQFSFRPSGGLKTGFPFFPIVAVFLAFISNGKAFFTAIETNTVEAVRKYRVGRKFTRLTEYDEAIILLSGILTSAFFVLFFSSLGKMVNVNLNIFVIVNFWLALYALLPIPPLDGGKILFGSRSLYIFSVAFIVALFLMKDLNIILSLLFSFIIAFILLIIYYRGAEY